MTNAAAGLLIDALRHVVGRRHVIIEGSELARFTTGYRTGAGEVVAAVRPANLLEMWRVAEHCTSVGAVMIVQAANTGLTGGSTPHGRYDRPAVVVSTARIRRVFVIGSGRQAVCLGGATLTDLESALAPFGREPHSVIGSSCIGASVIGGVCNNSGGALIRRGPAFTELALYGRIDSDGALRLVNTLGIELGEDPATVLSRLEAGDFTEADITYDEQAQASDREYNTHVRDIRSPTPARFNADPRRHFEAAGCAGKLLVFAVRVDSFPPPERKALFYIGTNDPADLTRIRRESLTSFSELPISAEYMNRTAFTVAERYGKDVFLALELFGARRIGLLFAWKNWVERAARALRLGSHVAERALQRITNLLPSHLPRRMLRFHRLYEHHLLLHVGGAQIDEAKRLLNQIFPSAAGDVFECTPGEARKALTHRFAVAGAAVRYRAVHRQSVSDILALDFALPRSARSWAIPLPAEVQAGVSHDLLYGHFFCHVFHQDLIVRAGYDPETLAHRVHGALDARGAEYPAEHNVGHLYKAKPALEAFYRRLDPRNRFNPGIGQTSREADWGAIQELTS